MLPPVAWTHRKKSRVDICNICLRRSELSYDHVPPQGAIDVTELEVNHLFGVHDWPKPLRPRFVQDGVKFRTICRDCNTLIGGFDRSLIELTKSVRFFAANRLALPSGVGFTFKPNGIIRAIAGHILASVLQPDTNRFSGEVRTLLNDVNAPVPDHWNVYYWLYLTDATVIMKDILISDPFDEVGEPGWCQILKFFPMAFLICDNPRYFDLGCLTGFKRESADYEARLQPIPFGQRHQHWPERFSGSPFTMNAMTVGQFGTRAIPRRSKRRS